MAGSLSCSACEILWPPLLESYRRCPGCGGRTWHSWKQPTEAGEANQRAFERFYELRHAALAAMVDECEPVDVEVELTSD